MKKRILFVDDDPKVLGELQRTLLGMGSEWESNSHRADGKPSRF